MKTLFLLLAQYDGKAVIPADQVRKDFFSHLDLGKFLRKTSDGSIPLTVFKVEQSQKSFRGVHLKDLADYLDARREEAVIELKRIKGL